MAGALVVLVTGGCPVWLLVLAGRGTVCDTTEETVLFSPVCGNLVVTELCTFLVSVSVKIFVFTPCSAAAAGTAALIPLELHLLAGTWDGREGTLHCWPFFFTSHPNICFMDLSDGCPADLSSFVTLTAPSSLSRATVRLGTLDAGFCPQLI